MKRTLLLPLALPFLAASIGLLSIQCGGSTPPPVATTTTTPSATTTASPAPSVDPTSTASAKTEPSEPPHWSYDGDHGPDHWGDLSSDWSACKSGTSQTPIDIVAKGATKAKDLSSLDFAYSPLPLQIFNNGHTVQVQVDGGATLTAAGETWQLTQFHLHSPSEHTFDGKHFDAELHLVHKSSKGASAVVGILFAKGKENKPLAALFDNAPTEVTSDAKTIEKQTIDLAPLLPKKASYYTYAGSLTTPPCTEGVTWFVLASTATISDAQLARFRTATHGDTSRPVQPLGARTVSFFK